MSEVQGDSKLCGWPLPRWALGSVPLNVFIEDVAYGAERILSNFIDNTWMWVAADVPEGQAAIQRDPHGLEKWFHRNVMKINKVKCKVLNLWRNNPM